MVTCDYNNYDVYVLVMVCNDLYYIYYTVDACMVC